MNMRIDSRTIVPLALAIFVSIKNDGSAALLVCEPDDFAPFTDLTNACPHVTLVVETDTTLNPVMSSESVSEAPSGDQVFRHDSGSLGVWEEPESLLRGDFAILADFVSLQFQEEAFNADFVFLQVFDSGGVMLDEATGEVSVSSPITTLSISRPTADIASFLAGGELTTQFASVTTLDDLRYNPIPAPATATLFTIGLAGVAIGRPLMRRRTQPAAMSDNRPAPRFFQRCALVVKRP